MYIARTHEEAISNFIKIHGNKFDYSKVKYVNANTKIKIGCPNHGYFYTTYGTHVNAKIGCKKCAYDLRKGKVKFTTEVFVTKAKKVHKNRYSYKKSKYTHSTKKIIITCPKHGDFLQIPWFHLNGNGCVKCGKDSRSKKITCKQDDIIRRFNKVHKDKYSYKHVYYVRLTKNVDILCPIHGKFSQTPAVHLSGGGCPKCAKGSQSKKENEWLDFLGIAKKYRRHEIRNKSKRFVVDGFDKKNNTVYEFLGNYWHGNPEIHKTNSIHHHLRKTFRKIHNETFIRLREIKKLGYKVIYIWESDFDKGNSYVELL